jgi:hypothetical protein
MTAKELKIGNYVDWNGEIAKISQLLEMEVFFKCGETDLYSSLKPIPLTEEWLLRLGFRKANEKLYFLPVPNLAMEIHSVFYRDTWLIELANDRKNIVTEAFQVHQLQNLYFALTDEELTIKP